LPNTHRVDDMTAEADRDYFLIPCCPAQRQYEALRAVFVGGLSQKDAAGLFGYTHGAFRQLVFQFRTARRAGQAPPFSPRPGRAGRPPSRESSPAGR
jgi:hypothetical protein